MDKKEVKKDLILLAKAAIWEILSTVLGFGIVYFFTKSLGISVKIALVSLVIKTVFLTAYDIAWSKYLEKKGF